MQCSAIHTKVLCHLIRRTPPARQHGNHDLPNGVRRTFFRTRKRLIQ